jgi:hypothetical protein
MTERGDKLILFMLVATALDELDLIDIEDYTKEDAKRLMGLLADEFKIDFSDEENAVGVITKKFIEMYGRLKQEVLG